MNEIMITRTKTLESLRQHQLVIVRRLLRGPLTEFELAHEVAEASAYTEDEASDRMAEWLEELRAEGLVWAGRMFNVVGQEISVAALTTGGRKLVR